MINKFPKTENYLSVWTLQVENEQFFYDLGIAWPKISIVTPSFNQGQYIEETILSVLSQNYPNLEYIIIDGGSTDNTVSIIKKYEDRITYWVSEPDKGQSHAINKGIEKCTGEIFNWLNSDDFYMPDTLFDVAKLFIEDSSLQFVSGFENHISIEGAITLCKGTFLLNSLEQTIEMCEVTQPSIQQIKGVPEDMHYIMDGEMWVKLLLQYGQQHFKKIEKVLVNFRLHENSKTVSNTVVNNFLFERSSIIIDLQRFVNVPEQIIQYYISDIYKTPQIYNLGRSWQMNESLLTRRRLRIYFIKKFITDHFKRKRKEKAFWGIKQLIRDKVIDLFLLKNLLKWSFKKYDT